MSPSKVVLQEHPVADLAVRAIAYDKGHRDERWYRFLKSTVTKVVLGAIVVGSMQMGTSEVNPLEVWHGYSHSQIVAPPGNEPGTLVCHKVTNPLGLQVGVCKIARER
jgi:hypothetical protein